MSKSLINLSVDMLIEVLGYILDVKSHLALESVCKEWQKVFKNAIFYKIYYKKYLAYGLY